MCLPREPRRATIPAKEIHPFANIVDMKFGTTFARGGGLLV